MSELAYLSRKREKMAINAAKFDDNVIGSMNTIVSSVETSETIGKNIYNLSSLLFGQQSELKINNNITMYNRMIIFYRLYPLVVNQTVCRGWGFRMTDLVQYTIGATDVPAINIENKSHFHSLMGQCQTSEARNEIFRLSGDELLAPIPVDPNNTYANYPVAYCIVPLPWSNYLGGTDSKLPFEAGLLNQYIGVNIRLAQANQIYGGTGAMPSGLHAAWITFDQTDYTYPELSLSMMKPPKTVYPYIYPILNRSAIFAGSTQGSPIVLPLQGFISADLYSIVLSVHRVTDETSTSSNSVSPYNADPIREVLLQYNGATIYYSREQAYKLYNMKSILGSSYLHNSVISAGTTAPFTSNPIDTYCVFIDFSRLRCLTSNYRFPNTPNYSAQLFNLSFFTSTTDNYICYYTYYYPANCEIDPAGNSHIYWGGQTPLTN